MEPLSSTNTVSIVLCSEEQINLTATSRELLHFVSFTTPIPVQRQKFRNTYLLTIRRQNKGKRAKMVEAKKCVMYCSARRAAGTVSMCVGCVRRGAAYGNGASMRK